MLCTLNTHSHTHSHTHTHTHTHTHKHTQDVLDYNIDSDDEWEEEDPGESISNSEVSQDR